MQHFFIVKFHHYTHLLRRTEIVRKYITQCKNIKSCFFAKKKKKIVHIRYIYQQTS